MSRNNWVYGDPAWWLNAIHLSCSRQDTLTPGIVSRKWVPVSEDSLEELSHFYSSSLAVIANGTLAIEDAATLLFRAKSLKKWKLADPVHAAERENKAISGFIQRNAEAKDAELIPYPYNVWMRDILHTWLPEPESLGWSWTGRFGPGEVAEKLTHPRRFEQLTRWCSLSPHWPDVPLNAREAQHSCTRLSAVPKDYSKDRLITVEPSYGSFAQAYVREAVQCSIHGGPLRGTAMDLNWIDGPTIQQRLALKASKNGKLATLDLSDASDGITWNQVQQVFPAWVLSLLDTTRSEEFSYDVRSTDGTTRKEYCKMYILAGMGNGSTFTIETLFFAAFVVAYARAHGLPAYVSVYGDDIICHSLTARSLMIENFSFFKINQSKSFLASDALRESCGIFAYKGVDITAPKVDGYLNNIEGRLGLCDLHYRLYRSHWAYAQRLSYLIASEGILVNWSSRYPGYPSIDDDRCERSVAPPTRYNSHIQCKEAHLPIREQASCTYSTDWRFCKKWNHPEPEIWYTAALAGMLGRRDYSITSESSRRRWSVEFPVKGKFRDHLRWVQALRACDPLVAKATGCESHLSSFD